MYFPFLLGQGLSSTCKGEIDVIFMVDGSWSVGGQFRTQLKFVTNVVDKLGGISQDGVHASVVVTSTSSKVHIGLNSFSDNNQFKNAVRLVSAILIYHHL